MNVKRTGVRHPAARKMHLRFSGDARVGCGRRPRFREHGQLDGGCRIWFLTCFVLLFWLNLAGAAWAVPPGTVVDNVARAAYSVRGAGATAESNTVTLVTEWPRTSAQMELLQYAPGVGGADQLVLAAAAFDSDGIAGGPTRPIEAIYPAGGTTPIDLARPIPLIDAAVYHQGEPMFVRVADGDQNIDPLVGESIWVQLRVPGTGDVELLVLTETAADSGVFAGYIQSSGLGPVQAYNGILDVAAGDSVQARYTDIADATDTVATVALVDPFGLVFDSTTGQPVDDAQLTLIDDATGQPATVFGDDGVSSFPATIPSGGTVVDGRGKVYDFEPGRFRFPFVLPGTYRLQATPPGGYAAPSTVPTDELQALPGAPFVIAEPGSRGEAFVLNPGPVIRLDIPLDPAAMGLWLRKTANRDEAAIGDFVQYTIGVENISGAPARDVRIHDRLPLGFRFRKGSVRLDGITVADPEISADGRTLTFSIGDLAPEANADLRYVTEIAAGARPGKAENRADAEAGSLSSNRVAAVVMVREDLFRSRNFIAGRVIADHCDESSGEPADGVAGVRIYLEDGTYTVTDDQGRYHFEGIASGSHVVQLDLDSLPERYEISACGEDTRAAGTPFSRFVDLHGGTLWRTDFHVETKAPPTGEVALDMACELKGRTVTYDARIEAQRVALDNMRFSVVLPDGVAYLPGSSRRDGRPVDDPQVMDTVLIYRLGAWPAGSRRELRFDVELGPDVRPGRLSTKALLTFHTPARQNQRSEMIETVLALKERRQRIQQPTLTVRPRFEPLGWSLSARDQRILADLADGLAGSEIEHVVVEGHTDDRPIRTAHRGRFADNTALSRARAESVAHYLAGRLGLTPDRITIVARGESLPVGDNATEAGRALNRRVEVRVMSVKVNIVQDIETIRCADGVATVTRGSHGAAPPETTPAPKTAAPGRQDFKALDLEALAPGTDWLMPAENFVPAIPSLKAAVQHPPGQTVTLRINGRDVHPLKYAGRQTSQSGQTAVTLWSGIGLEPGDNLLEAVCADENGRVLQTLARRVHYSGPPVKAVLVEEASRLLADGKSTPVIAVRLMDKDGHPARPGLMGDYAVAPPLRAAQPDRRFEGDLARVAGETTRYMVEEDGIARIALQPTTRSGYARVSLAMETEDQEIRAWLRPGARDWVLVGLAEGTAGYRTVSGNMEHLRSADEEEDFYDDGRLAFFAKGRIQGKWLLTAAFDSVKEIEDPQNNLFQAIDPDTYYTLYGDTGEQQYEAASIRKLFLKIERDQFYALFGDYDTGLTVTELSRYSRRLNGLKSEYRGARFGYSAFASDTDQAFVKDEIQGDGTSGLYRLSRKNILVNSEEVVIETRDRFRSEVIVARQTLSRHVDYDIDYDAGTLFFKLPVFGRDENFNPNFIVVTYESGDAGNEAYTYGGRGSVRLAQGRVEVGATAIHEGPQNAEGDLGGVDAAVDLGKGLRLKAEAAATTRTRAGEDISGQAYLAELRKQTPDLDAKLYFREQGEDFGLGQQNGSETATRKVGADAAWRIQKEWALSGEAYRNDNLATGARRDLGEGRVEYHQPLFDLYTGLRLAEDRLGNDQQDRSTQILAGGSRRLLDGRLTARLDHEQSLEDDNQSVDFPTRTLLGADYRLSDTTSLFAEHEITRGDAADTQSSRLGLKATPWSGGQVGTSVGRQTTADGQRLYSTLGLLQTWRLDDRWSVDGGLDRTQTVRHDGETAPFNTNVPTASGAGEDFTALSLGAGYRATQWSWTGRVESRDAETEDKWNLVTGVAGEVRKGLGMSAGMKFFHTATDAGTETLEGDVRLSLALRPLAGAWMVFDRLDYKLEDRKDAAGRFEARRIVNNLNTNWRPHHRLQVALQYGAKYVFDTIDHAGYSGYTDLSGIETRYDLTKRWDIGLHASVLHSWDAGQIDYRTGASVGCSLAKNTWLSLGYNLTGFTDEDFSDADYTAAGPFVKFRVKFDQQSVRELVDWFGRK